MKSFPCTQCGICCQNVHLSQKTEYLNRGDGTCKNYDTENKLCFIYNKRPDICRVDKQYKINYSNLYTWNNFVDINLQVCNTLKNISKNIHAP
ncbi:YkgJ family cysteine cluster protein [Malikia sp.]|uniref:YkgJ family cysteine cluster protein n=1 Tax=Malikia sp. TaxID=2070706 RepID=UPI00262B5164|nr:YkgJ family cysteine cluster protein [Malikia sp.]MDD2729036.1 YkgJ family cysteine cluster protein [Malikia sp.]